MPKHTPSFKHLIATSSKRDDTPRRERSVNERLAASRLDSFASWAGSANATAGPSQSSGGAAAGGAHTASQGRGQRQVPPHLARTGQSTAGETSRGQIGRMGNGIVDEDGDRAWSVSWETSGTGTASALDMDDGSVHPAELLRRSQLAHRAASRSVAGPAPPPSWRTPSSPSHPPRTGESSSAYNHSRTGQVAAAGRINKGREMVTTRQLKEAGALLGLPEGDWAGIGDSRRAERLGAGLVQGSEKGAESLSVLCQRLILRLLHDRTPILLFDEPPLDRDPASVTNDLNLDTLSFSELTTAQTESTANGNTATSTTIALATMEQLPHLDAHLRIALLDLSSTLSEDDPSRLTDAGIRALLADPPPDPVSASPVRDDFHLPSSSSPRAASAAGNMSGPGAEDDDWSGNAAVQSNHSPSSAMQGKISEVEVQMAELDWDDDVELDKSDALPLIARPEIRHLPVTLSTSQTIIPLLRDIQRSAPTSTVPPPPLTVTSPPRSLIPYLIGTPSPHPSLPPLPASFSSMSLSMVTLTSLNLAYSHIKDLERLVDALPPALRELGLAGVTFGGASGRGGEGRGRRRGGGVGVVGKGDQDGLTRGMGALGRKMLVLKVLDLSYISPFPTSDALSLLLSPAQSKVPSLRLLGLRSSSSPLPSPPPMSTPSSPSSRPQPASAAHMQEDQSPVGKHLVELLLRDPARVRSVEVVWD